MERVEPRSPQWPFVATLVISIALHVVVSVHLPTWSPSPSASEPFLVEFFTAQAPEPTPLPVREPTPTRAKVTARPHARRAKPAQPAPHLMTGPVGALVVPEGKRDAPPMPFVPLVDDDSDEREPDPVSREPDREPRLLEELRVTYPAQARDADVEGEVELRVTIDADGRVLEAIVLRGPGYGLDRAALDAVRRSRWAPGFREGHATKRTLVWVYHFVLQ